MSIKIQVKLIDFFLKMLNGTMHTVDNIKYIPQKELMNNSISLDVIPQKLPRCTPEEQGVESGYVSRFFKRLQEAEDVKAHGVMILRNGFVIAEGEFAPYRNELWHITHSMSKSITCLAVGIAVDEGFFTIEDSVAEIFNKTYLPIIGKRQRELKVKHLLSMSSGVTFNEAGTVTESDWIKFYLDSGIAFEPGKEFHYNSMNSYILSAVIRERTGMGLMEYLKEKVFNKMGIYNVYWEKCPKGIEKGGWGLLMTIEDMAKVGQLFLQKGRWEQQQLVSEAWIDLVTSKQINTPKELGAEGYGYHVWIGKRPGAFQFNGMLSQNVIVLPDIQMVIATTGGSSELFMNSHFMDIINDFFEKDYMPAEKLAENPAAYDNLQRVLRNLCFEKGFSSKSQNSNKRIELFYRGGWKRNTRCNRLEGRTPDLDEEYWKFIANRVFTIETTGIHVFPLFLQVLQNNFARGLKEISFLNKKFQKYMILTEQGRVLEIPIDFKKYCYCQIEMNGEIYEAATACRFVKNEDDVLVLKVMVSFLETSNSRVFKFFFEKDKVLIRCDEIPKISSIMEGISMIVNNNRSGKFDSIANSDFVQYKLIKIIEPEAECEEKGTDDKKLR
ncbi:serine hydrolase domain-containing protein [Anaeromicropila populeti]|uniref:CubicO group peptidase, beta-lactamase class C family n=1 Tax=Anaeromicropila populeti TaxID=37658 RepID=A0A1I6JN57_9FIRM|nr:serine hydrolase [Anaeromicropila populeti]SFR80406.1 CubicO group peptidase, beta-lactamase class C family [Anaeromicropila populeti]